ncbi:hypothetical protein D3C81_1164780 [compost metagenome]
MFGLADLQPVTLGVLDGEVLDGEVVTVDQQPFGAGFLALEAEYGLVPAGATDSHAIGAQAQAALEMMLAGRDLDHVARFGIEQAFLQRGRKCPVRRGDLRALRRLLLAAGRQHTQCGGNRQGNAALHESSPHTPADGGMQSGLQEVFTRRAGPAYLGG